MNGIRIAAILLLSALVGPASAFVRGASTPPVVIPANTFVFNLTFNADAMGQPQAYRDAFTNAAAQISAVVADTATVNVTIGFGTLRGGGPLASNVCASDADVGSIFSTYTVQHPIVTSHLTTADGITYTSFMPSGSTLDGSTSSFFVAGAFLKVSGQRSPTDPTSDGYAACGSDYTVGGGNNAIIVGAILHELTHVMGRLPNNYFPFVAGCYGGVGVRLISCGGDYLSLNNGTTSTAEYDSTDNGVSFNQTGPQGGNDPLCATIHVASTLNTLTSADLKQITALGFNLK